MKCAWDSFINLIPLWMRESVNRIGRDALRELRMRINAPPELVMTGKSVFLTRRTTREDIDFTINLATQYSPWSSETVREGFITVPGGHRFGLCGIIMHDHRNAHVFSTVTSLCIRIARDFPGIAKSAAFDGSVLIIGRPGCGKTTFLRDLVRQISIQRGCRVAVVDERQEVFPIAGNAYCFDTGETVDVLSGCSKAVGIQMVLRTMTPSVIAVDEITAQVDADALIHSIGCGVSLLATAHASSVEDLRRRNIYRPLLEQNIFQFVVLLNRDATWRVERCAG